MENTVLPIIMLIIIIVGFFAYIKSLINAAKTKKWTWFVLMLLIWPLFILYLLISYSSGKDQ